MSKKKTTTIQCLGYETNTPNGRDYDCEYEHAPACDDCVINRGPIDPRTGKKLAKNLVFISR
jgi:hypothetical protein